MPTKPLMAGLAAVLLLTGCNETTTSTTTDTTVAPSPAQPATTLVGTDPTGTLATGVGGDGFATVSGPISGNRILRGSANLIAATPVDIPLGGSAAWVIGVPAVDDPTWVVALEDGTVQAWRLRTSGPEQVPLGAPQLPPGTPPVVTITPDGIVVVPPPAAASTLTYPVGVGGRLLYIDTAGHLVLAEGSEATSLDIEALPDSRISVSRDGLVSVLAGPTDRYAHGVLGDELEAGRIVVVDPEKAAVVGEAVVPEPSVVEGIAAPWVDTDGDGVEELLVTISNAESGARLALFDRGGKLVALGPPIGRGNRWRNQLGAGPMGPNGEIEIIDVRVPHIGGVVEYFRVDGDQMVLQVQQPGFTSHVYGARNLDLALIADVTGDNRMDTLVPNQELSALGVLSRTEDGVDVVAELPLPGHLTTNLAGSTFADGGIAIAVGTSDGILRVYATG